MTDNLIYDEFWDEIDSFDVSVIQNNKHLLKQKNRSSTIFPIFKNSHIETSIQFLSYWLKKT